MSSLITRCPACATMFKVVPDQLRVSDGWVRCGQCNEVFDANSNLQPRADLVLNTAAAQAPRSELPPPAPAPAVSPPIARVAQVAVEPKIEAKVAARVVTQMEEKAEVQAQAVVPVAATVPPQAEPFLTVNPRALHIDPEPAESGATPPRPATLGEQRSAVGRGDKPRRKSKEPTTEQGAEEPRQHSFMKAGNAASVWGRPWARVALWVTCLLMVLGLVLQVLVQERDRIAATEPSAMRMLLPLCEVLACKISPLRQIEAIVIDSSSFAKVREDVYRLSFTLKNTAQTAIATPALELTLTDMQDQAVVRRVLAVADFGRHQAVMEPGAELIATVAVAVKPITGTAKVSGYRLLSFYP